MSVDGERELQRRFLAVKASPRQMLRTWQVLTVRKAKQAAPRKTANLHRNIVAGALSEDDATVRARTGYAKYLEFGTGLYGPNGRAFEIKPRFKKALAWPTTRSASRLSGAPTKAARGGRLFPVTGRISGGATPRSLRIRAIRGVGAGPAQGPITVRRSVLNPGIRPRPFLVPAAKESADEVGISVIVDAWNGAA